MPRVSRGYLTVLLFLLLAVLASWAWGRWGAGSSALSEVEEADQEGSPPSGQPLFTSFIDVEGWYQVTPYERAVAGPVDLTLREGLAQEFPRILGSWEAVGENLPLDPEVNRWFRNPELAFLRLYENQKGDSIYLSVIGNRGGKSFSLFEHTPVTCEPGAGWEITDEGLEAIEVGESTAYARRVVVEREGSRRVVLFWYAWNSPERDPENGLLSMRIHAEVEGTVSETLEMEKEFFRLLFPVVLPWHRFR